MNREHILARLKSAGFNAELTAGTSTLTLAFDVGEQRITLVHSVPGRVVASAAVLAH